MTCNVYVSIANEYRKSEVIEVEVTYSVRCETSHITVEKNLVVDSQYSDMKIVWR